MKAVLSFNKKGLGGQDANGNKDKSCCGSRR
jgi:hypothetical protein